MSTSRKAEKRQKRKEKKRKELEAKLSEEKVKFDVLKLLEETPLDTKPNMAKFLKEHVETVRGLCQNKIAFYPNFKYELSKVFVKFLDGHELIYDMLTDGKITPRFYFCCAFDEIELSAHGQQLVEEFF